MIKQAAKYSSDQEPRFTLTLYTRGNGTKRLEFRRLVRDWNGFKHTSRRSLGHGARGYLKRPARAFTEEDSDRARAFVHVPPNHFKYRKEIFCTTQRVGCCGTVADAGLLVRKRKKHLNQNRLLMCSQVPRSRLHCSAQRIAASPCQPHKEMVRRAEVRLLGVCGVGLPLLGMSALLKPVDPIRMLPRRSRDKTLRDNSAFETSVMLLCPIANSCIPA
jgi:hypothetical protein